MLEQCSAPRAHCYVCFKPQNSCICHAIQKVKNQTHVMILQHPHEYTHPLGTARIARLSFSNITIDTCWNDLKSHLHENQTERLQDVALLYPSANAIELNNLPKHDLPKTLIVLDGTWSQAKSLYKTNTWLHGLRHIKIVPAQPGNYRIRKEPHPHCLSTIEAIVQALQIIEPSSQFLSPLHAFDALIEQQISHEGKHTGTPRRRKPRQKSFASNSLYALAQQKHRMVVIAGEFIASQGESKANTPIHWQALRFSNLERFSCIIASPSSLKDVHLQHMQLQPNTLNCGVSIDTFKQQWKHFLTPHDILVVWNQHVANICQTFSSHHAWVLKALYCNYQKGPSGDLSDIVAQLKLQPIDMGHSRSETRLSHMRAVITHLTDLFSQDTAAFSAR